MPRLDLIQYRRGTEGEWNSRQPVLLSGEVGYDTTNNQIRVGDGATAWGGLVPIGGSREEILEALSLAQEAASDSAASAELAVAAAAIAEDFANQIPSLVESEVSEQLSDPASSASVELNSRYASIVTLTGLDEADTNLIQAAIDAGGQILLRGANSAYQVGGIVMKTGAHLDLGGLTLRARNGLSNSLITTEDYAILTGGSVSSPDAAPHSWSISNGSIDGNKASQTGISHGICIYGHTWKLTNIEVRNCRNDGVHSEFSRGFALDPGSAGIEGISADLDIHHCDGWGYYHKGPSDSVLKSSFIWENGLGSAAGGLWFDAGANGFTLSQVHTYGNVGWSIISDAQVFLSSCQIEGGRSGALGVECGGVWLRFPESQISGGAIYYTASAPSSGTGLRIGSLVGPTYATRTKVDTSILYCTGADAAHAAINYAADSHSDVKALVYTTSGAFAVTGTPSAASVQQIKVVGSAPSIFHAIGATRFNVPVSAESFTIHDGSERRLNVDTASGTVGVGRSDLVVYSDDLATEKIRLTRTGGITSASTAKPTVSAGSGAGAGAPVPVLDAESNLLRGSFTCGTGTSPASSQILASVSLAGFSRKPTVLVTPGNGAAMALSAIATVAADRLSFNIYPTVAPAASQAATAYRFNYLVIG